MSDTDYGDVLGLEPGSVRLHPYTNRWVVLFEDEANRIRDAIGESLVDLQHYGSTAVPGLRAKPIIDILGGLESLEVAVRCIEPLAEIGYDYAGADVIPGHHVFGRGHARTHLLHLVEHGSPQWNNNLRFRDALRLDPELAQRYEALKLRLAREHSESRGEYTAGKTEFVRNVLTPQRITDQH